MRQLDDFLGRIRPHIPPGSRVAVSSEPGPEGERFFRTLWVAYLMPEMRVSSAAPEADWVAGDYRLSYGTHLADPKFDPVVEAYEGALYLKSR